MRVQFLPKQIQIFVINFARYTKKGKIMKISIKINGIVIYKGELDSYRPSPYITSKEKGYISNLLFLIKSGSSKEWIKLKDDTTITISIL